MDSHFKIRLSYDAHTEEFLLETFVSGEAWSYYRAKQLLPHIAVEGTKIISERPGHGHACCFSSRQQDQVSGRSYIQEFKFISDFETAKEEYAKAKKKLLRLKEEIFSTSKRFVFQEEQL